MMIKYIFFDLGNTIIDLSVSRKALYFGLKSVLSNKLITEELVLKWEKETYNTFEHYHKKGEFYTIKRLQAMSLKNVLLEYDIDLAERKIIDIVSEFRRHFIKNCRLYDDVIPTVSQLIRDDYKLGLITNGDGKNVNSILKKHNLDKMFKTKVISSVIRSYKPNLLLFERALELAKCLHQEAIYVGDSVIDIYGAKKLGIIAVIINRNKTQDTMTEIEPDFTIASLFQLYPIIKNISGES